MSNNTLNKIIDNTLAGVNNTVDTDCDDNINHSEEEKFMYMFIDKILNILSQKQIVVNNDDDINYKKILFYFNEFLQSMPRGVAIEQKVYHALLYNFYKKILIQIVDYETDDIDYLAGMFANEEVNILSANFN